MADAIAVDLGTSLTKIYLTQKNAIIFDEPTCLAYDKEYGKVVDIGYLAFKALGRSPYGIRVEFPIRDGMVADVTSAYRLIDQVFVNLNRKRTLRNSKFIVGAPNELTPVEKGALIEVFKRLGAREITLVPNAKAVALGAGFDVESPSGILVLDIGGGDSDCGAISMGEIVVAHSTKVGGQAFDKAIDRFIKNKKGLMIGPRASEQVKMRIGSVSDKSENQFFEVSGRSIATGLPSTAIVSTAELLPLFAPLVAEIEENVQEVIQDIPAEMVGDIVKGGLLLSGGGSLIAGMKEVLERDLRIPVRHISDASHSVIVGLAKLAKE